MYRSCLSLKSQYSKKMPNLEYKCILKLVIFLFLHNLSSEITVYIEPSLSQSYHCHVNNSCLTLSQFASNSSRYVTVDSNLTLFISGGSHLLDTSISLSHILGFSLLSINDSDLRSTIICKNSANFTLGNITQVCMHGIVFHGCGGSRVQSVSQLIIENSTFRGANNSKTSITIIESKASLTTTTFLSNVIGTYKNNADILIPIGNSLGTFSVSHGGALITTHSILVIMHCHFENNKANIGGYIYMLILKVISPSRTPRS